MLRCTLLCCTSLLLSFTSLAQQVEIVTTETPGIKEAYFSSGSEWIFSTPILDVNGSDKGAVVRFAPFFNVQGMLNYDLSSSFGLFTGLSMRNQGFIYKVPNDSLDVRIKFRTYNLGIPVGFKVGTMNNTLVYLGYEFELPFNYKEKRFENEKKEKFDVWFSKRSAPFYQSVFIGFQGPGSSTLTIRYYLTNFHNKDYMETVDGVQTKPYEGLNANVLAVSLGFGLFDGKVTKRNTDFLKPDPQAWGW